MPQARLITVSSTSVAAETALREEGAAAVASREAAVRYGLRILFGNIEDSPFNETRFAVIGPEEKPKSGHDKTAVMFKIPHRPGSLVDSLNIFKQNKLNLTWIESFPAKSQKSEYVFFVDFEGHQEDAKVKRALAILAARCDELTVLGPYPMPSIYN